MGHMDQDACAACNDRVNWVDSTVITVSQWQPEHMQDRTIAVYCPDCWNKLSERNP